MKYFSKVFFILSLAFCFSSCNDIIEPANLDTNEVPVRIAFSMAGRAPLTKSKVSGEETKVTVMQLVCFDANGQYLGIRNAEVSNDNPTASGFYDSGIIKGTVPQGTARIHFIANRGLSIPLSHSNGTSESEVMNSAELSTAYNDADHQKVCYWGYHKEADANAMSEWLKPAEGSGHIVYMIRDRARVVLTYDPTGAPTPVTKIEWLIHNGRERGYLAPAKENWSNTGYYGNSSIAGHTSDIISTAAMHEYENCPRYSLWTSETENDVNNFDVAYQSTGTYTPKPQFLFEDDNEDIDDLKVILRVTYTVSGSPKTVYHVLRLNQKDETDPDKPAVLYDIVRNNTYYIDCKLLSPDVASYETLQAAIEGEEFVNAEVEVDRTIPDINNNQYTLQIKLKNEGTSIVLSSEGEHTMDFVYRLVSDVSQTGSTDPNDFEVYWEKSQDFCSQSLPVTYNQVTKQFTITATVLEGKLTNRLQDQWIVVRNKTSNLKRYIHVYVIDQFRYKLYPTLTLVDATNKIYKLNFQLPPIEHTQFLPDGSGDPNELIYPESLYPIDIKFTTNTLNAYNNTQSGTNYGLFGVSVESTAGLVTSENFEDDYDEPVSSTSTADMSHWYFQQGGNFWDFWYTYQLKTYPTAGQVEIYFKDVRDNIKYATVEDVGLFLYVEYFGKNYSVPLRGINLDQTAATIAVNETLQLTATVTPPSAVTWSSSDPAVATVDGNGLVTAVSVGIATITATAGGISATCEITVDNSRTVTITPSDSTSASEGDVTITFARGSGNNDPDFSSYFGKYLYRGNTATITVPSGKTITKVVISEYNSASYSGNFDASTGQCLFDNSTYKATWTAASATSQVVLTSQGGGYYGDNDIDCLSFEVTYE